MRSLRSRLLLLWLLSAAAAISVGVLLVQLYELSAGAQAARMEVIVGRACDLIRDRYGAYAAGWPGPAPRPGDGMFQRDLAAAAGLALSKQAGVEGGFWQVGIGPVAYAFPTYQGAGPKTDLPAAEYDRIAAVNAEAARTEMPVLRSFAASSQTLLLQACPISQGPVPGLTAWSMARTGAAPGLDRLQAGLGLLLALVVSMSAWLARLTIGWSRHVARIEVALRQNDVARLPRLALTGERELDRIVMALNQAGERLAAARGEAEALDRRVAAAERLAALGRVAAGLAHEIRNPLAAMRLRAENALAAGDDARRRTALSAVLDQVGRLDRLVADLLAMTHRRATEPRQVHLPAFLADVAAEFADEAAARNVSIEVQTPGRDVWLDPRPMERCLSNLVQNAVRHTPAGGKVRLRAELGETLGLVVEDTGPGIDPAVTDSLFEPFVTTWPEGTGLGLAIVRELAEAQGGRAVLRDPGGGGRGAVLAIELPQEAGWRVS